VADSGSLLVQTVQWLTDPANWQGPSGIGARLVEHLVLSGVSLAIACVVALPVGLWLGHVGRGQLVVINVANAGRAVPTYALLVLLAIGPLGLGAVSTVVALVLFAIPPILTNAYAGVRGVDPEVVDAARGMGLAGGQVLRRVELPLAVPLIVTGVRLSAVQVIATATIAALVAGGGLGRIITAGFATQNIPELLAGALLVAAFALLVEGGFGLAVRRVRRY
jgi:osmoprotectant transport system permease protein